MAKSKTTQKKNNNLEAFQNSQSKTRKAPTISPENVPATTPESESMGNPIIQNRKTRFFSLMTYASEKQLRRVIEDHIRSVRAFCYILHDKDEAVPHYHILMRTHSTWTSAQIRRWFHRLVDADKKPINTFCEPASSMDALDDYIFHADDKSVAQGKHQYSRDQVKDFGIWDLAEKKDSYDDSYEIINQIIAGKSYRELVRTYGRKFLFHWDKYADVAAEIRQDEGYKEARERSKMELYLEPRYVELTSLEDMYENGNK